MLINLLEIIKLLFLSINRDVRKKIFLLIVLMTLASILEFLSIGSIIPLISSFLNFNIQENNNYFLNYVFGYFESGESFKTTIIYIFILIIFLSTIFRLIVFRISIRLTAVISSDLGSKIFNNTIIQPYEEIINQSSNILISNVTEKMAKASGIIFSIFNFISGAIISLGILIALLVFNPVLTLVVISLFGSLYLIIANTSKFYLKKNSLNVAKYSEYRIKFLQESIGSIRDIILDRLYKIYNSYYKNAESNYRIAEANISTIAAFPKILIEGLGIIMLLMLCNFYFQGNESNNSNLIISLGVFAYAANRLLPMFHNIYQSWALIVGNLDILNDIKSYLYLKETNQNYETTTKIDKKFQIIEFNNVSFSYQNSRIPVLNDINFKIDLKNNVGIIGKTGVGKSTFVDLIMGLLKPTKGKILLDKIELDPKIISEWQNQISHVPQDIFLLNDTIKNNITFDQTEQGIDNPNIMKAIENAELKDFVDNLPDGIQTIVGENGINISGGQKQRIGIARALYKNKNLYIFDEATNALDHTTEENIYKNIFKNYNNISIISITHRINNLAKFSQIIDLNLLKKNKS